VDQDTARATVLDAAERLYYARGVRAVGMDEIRAASGVSLKRLYQLFPAKQDLVTAYLARRDPRWRGELLAFARAAGTPREQLLAVFDWLGRWFRGPGFRGCAWINSFGELGAESAAVAGQAREHKLAFRADLAELVAAAGLPDALTDQFLLLAEGAMVSAAILGDPGAAATARAAAETLLSAAR
jgi:AcrR family transcriptional regulator